MDIQITQDTILSIMLVNEEVEVIETILKDIKVNKIGFGRRITEEESALIGGILDTIDKFKTDKNDIDRKG